MFEASMNFDLSAVRPFLERLEDSLALDLPVDELVDLARTTPVDEERSRMLRVTFDGTTTQLEYRVFMDDIEAPDLYFFTPSELLAERIGEQMDTAGDGST